MAPVEMTISDFIKHMKAENVAERDTNPRRRSEALTAIVKHIQQMTKEKQLVFYELFEQLMTGEAYTINSGICGDNETIEPCPFTGLILVLRFDNNGTLKFFHFAPEGGYRLGKNYGFTLKNNKLIIFHAKADLPLDFDQTNFLVSNLYFHQLLPGYTGYEHNFYFTLKDFAEAKFMYE